MKVNLVSEFNIKLNKLNFKLKASLPTFLGFFNVLNYKFKPIKITTQYCIITLVLSVPDPGELPQA